MVAIKSEFIGAPSRRDGDVVIVSPNHFNSVAAKLPVFVSLSRPRPAGSGRNGRLYGGSPSDTLHAAAWCRSMSMRAEPRRTVSSYLG
jgi:hypothetical protein